MIELTVTVLPVPTFLSEKVEPTVCPNVSEPTKPEKVNVVVAVVNHHKLYSMLKPVAVRVLGFVVKV